jgi:voltage-gated potassium channel
LNARDLAPSLRKPLTARRAARLIMSATLLITLAAGTLMWLVDHREFPDLGTSLWWAVQTVTTVGYGDVVPSQTGGRFIGAVAMLQGIAFITVITAAVTASLIEQARRRRGITADSDLASQLERIDRRLRAIESALAESRDARARGPAGPEGPPAGS